MQLLKDQGINPYPSEVNRTHKIDDVLTSFLALETDKVIISLVGRVMIVRGQGAIMFVVLQDASGRLQVVFKEDVIPEETFQLFKDTIDAGVSKVKSSPLVLPIKASPSGDKYESLRSWILASSEPTIV